MFRQYIPAVQQFSHTRYNNSPYATDSLDSVQRRNQEPMKPRTLSGGP
jgi:hypothetical protein